jgi:hypothetical protein
MRQNQLTEIKAFVDNQGTLVQESGFENISRCHHLNDGDLNINGLDILYVSEDAIYCKNGVGLYLNELPDGDLLKVYSLLIR